MTWLKEYPREYYQKYERVQVQSDYGWYQVYRLPGNVYAICEPQHFQEVNFFLIIGERRALLLDTGEGFCPVRPLIEELYSGEIIACNSHFHFDHIASNYEFQPIHVYEDDYVRQVAENGLPKEALGAQLDEEMFQFGYPKNLDAEHFYIKPYETVPVADGHVFDLGGRKIKVLHTPGHSNDCIMLYDEENKILFTGDTFYLGALYAHFDCDEFGHGSVEQYCETMKRLAAEIPEDVNCTAPTMTLSQTGISCRKQPMHFSISSAAKRQGRKKYPSVIPIWKAEKQSVNTHAMGFPLSIIHRI